MSQGGCAAGGCGSEGVGLNQEYLPILTDRIDSPRYANGNVVQVQTTFPRVRDTRGRIAHVVDMKIVAEARFSTDSSAITVQSDMQHSLLTNLKLRDVSGHEYYAGGIDWRRLDLDLISRDAGNLPVGLPADFATTVTVTATTTVTITFYHRFADIDEGGHYLKDGSIPLAAIRAYGSDAIEFQVRTTFASTVTGATFVGFTGAMDVYLGIVYWDDPYVDPGWQVKEYTIVENSSGLLDCERLTEYAVLRMLREDTGGETLAGFSNISVQVAGMDTKLGLTLARSREIDRMAYAQRDEVSFSTLGIPDGSTTRGLYLVPYQKNRKGSARGSIQYTWDRSTSVLNRFLHRTVKALTPERDQKIRAAVGALGGYVERTAVMNSAMGASSGLKPFLPKRVVKAA